MELKVVTNPNYKELHNLFERAFSEIFDDATGYFTKHPAKSQDSLTQWFDFDAMLASLPSGSLIEARDNTQLVGAAFIGKQHPMSWPDGHKAELFIIAVLPEAAHQGIGTTLLIEAENQARNMGAKSIIINAHSEQPQLHTFYEKNGFTRIGELPNYYDNGNAIFFLKKI